MDFNFPFCSSPSSPVIIGSSFIIDASRFSHSLGINKSRRVFRKIDDAERLVVRTTDLDRNGSFGENAVMVRDKSVSQSVYSFSCERRNITKGDMSLKIERGK